MRLLLLLGLTVPAFASAAPSRPPVASGDGKVRFVSLAPAGALVSCSSSHEKDESGKTITAINLNRLTLT